MGRGMKSSKWCARYSERGVPELSTALHHLNLGGSTSRSVVNPGDYDFQKRSPKPQDRSEAFGLVAGPTAGFSSDHREQGFCCPDTGRELTDDEVGPQAR